IGELDLEHRQVPSGQGATEPHRGQAAREVPVDGDGVVAADDPLSRLRPLLHVVVVQEPTGGFPVARPQRLPHRLGHLAAVPLVPVDPLPPPVAVGAGPPKGRVPLPPSTIVIPSMASLLLNPGSPFGAWPL